MFRTPTVTMVVVPMRGAFLTLGQSLYPRCGGTSDDGIVLEVAVALQEINLEGIFGSFFVVIAFYLCCGVGRGKNL